MDIKYVLASKSPRRSELFRYITNDFEILPAECGESVPEGVSCEEIPEFLAVQKCLDVVKRRPDALVIGCDTVVIIDDEILGKPHTFEKACEMLSKLSGRTHTVVSGVCLCFRGMTLSFSQSTRVTFYELTSSQISSYVEDSTPLDKAGAYGIQDKGGLFVKEIVGDYYNIVGFPIARLSREIDKLIMMAGGDSCGAV